MGPVAHGIIAPTPRIAGPPRARRFGWTVVGQLVMTPRTTSVVALVWLALLAGASAYPRAAVDDRGVLRDEGPAGPGEQLLRLPYGRCDGGLRLDSREAMLKGGKSGPALVPGDPEKSLLIQAVRQTERRSKMPKGGKLTADGDRRRSPSGCKTGRRGPPPRRRRRRALRRRKPAAGTRLRRRTSSRPSSARSGRFSRCAAPRAAAGQGRGVGEDRHRSLHPGAPRARRAEAGRRRRQARR